jgi:hypothetical protein
LNECTSRSLDGLCQWNANTPDFTVHGHAVGLERILCRTLQHGSVEWPFIQWPLLVRARGLRRTEGSVDVEHCHFPDAFNGSPQTLRTAIGAMFRLKVQAQAESPRVVTC